MTEGMWIGLGVVALAGGVALYVYGNRPQGATLDPRAASLDGAAQQGAAERTAWVGLASNLLGTVQTGITAYQAGTSQRAATGTGTNTTGAAATSGRFSGATSTASGSTLAPAPAVTSLTATPVARTSATTISAPITKTSALPGTTSTKLVFS